MSISLMLITFFTTAALVWVGVGSVAKIRSPKLSKCAIAAAILTVPSIAAVDLGVYWIFVLNTSPVPQFAVGAFLIVACAWCYMANAFNISVPKAGLALLPGLVGAAVAIGLHVSSFSVTRDTRPRSVCASHLKEIFNASYMYGMDGGCLPADLDVLVDEDYTTSEVLLCPVATLHGHCDYFYFPWDRYVADPEASTQPARQLLKLDGDPEKILACDYRDNHNGEGRNVLFLDGHTQWMSEEDIQKLLKKTKNTEFAKALRAAEGR